MNELLSIQDELEKSLIHAKVGDDDNDAYHAAAAAAAANAVTSRNDDVGVDALNIMSSDVRIEVPPGVVKNNPEKQPDGVNWLR